MNNGIKKVWKKTSEGIFKGILLSVLMLWAAVFVWTAPVQAASRPARVHTKAVTSFSTYRLRITWDRVEDADGYVIYRRENKKWVRIGYARSTASSYIHASSKTHPIVPAKKYVYTVRAYKKTKSGYIYSFYESSAPSGATRPHKYWETVGNDKYYYISGNKVSGFKTIDGYTYYFDKSTFKMQKNRIVGSSRSGFWYVGSDGIRCDDPVMCLAVNFVVKYAGLQGSAAVRLQKCYDAIWGVFRYGGEMLDASADRMSSFARYTFEKGYGDCYHGASAFAYAARALGYAARVGTGLVVSPRTGNTVDHGWTELLAGGTWYLYDTSMKRKNQSTNLYQLRMEEYPYELYKQTQYQLQVSKGAVTWS